MRSMPACRPFQCYSYAAACRCGIATYSVSFSLGGNETTGHIACSKTVGHIGSMARPSHREQIITEGLRLVHRNGFAATGVQAITQAAGVPKGSFYNHFTSKDAFGAVIINCYLSETLRILFWTLAESGTVRPLERLRCHLHQLTKMAAEQGWVGCLLGNFAAELNSCAPAIRSELRHCMECWRDLLADCVEQGQIAGEITRDLPAREIAAFLLDGWQGAMLRAKVEQCRAPLDTFAHLAFAAIIV